jgi:NAD(P)-dependent dehydrogenase (short-subunit alcohol dehydrogenase family)
MTRSFARDLGPHRIRVNTVVPGWVMTERQKTLWATPEALERHRENQCLPDLIEPVYLARMVLFLASDDAAMCTANNYRRVLTDRSRQDRVAIPTTSGRPRCPGKRISMPMKP